MHHANTRMGTQGEEGDTCWGRPQLPAPWPRAGRDRTLSAVTKLSFTCLGPGRPAPPQAASSHVAVLLVEETLGVRGEAAAAREAGNGFRWEPPGDAAKIQVFSQQLHIFPPGAFWDNASTGVGMICRGQSGLPTTFVLLAGEGKGQAPVGMTPIHSPSRQVLADEFRRCNHCVTGGWRMVGT